MGKLHGHVTYEKKTLIYYYSGIMSSLGHPVNKELLTKYEIQHTTVTAVGIKESIKIQEIDLYGLPLACPIPRAVNTSNMQYYKPKRKK